MSLSFADLTSDKGLKQLDAYFVARAYTFGVGPTAADEALIKLVGKCPPAKFPNAMRWFKHIKALQGSKAKFGKSILSVATGAGGGDDSDSDDMFGSDDDDSDDDMDLGSLVSEATLGKWIDVNRSQIVFEVKPMGLEVDLDELAGKICEITVAGQSEGRFDAIIEKWGSPMVTEDTALIWGEGYEKVPVAFGLFKLMVSCIVCDEVIGSDDLIEIMTEKFPEEISSIECHAMNKASQFKKKAFLKANPDYEE